MRYNERRSAAAISLVAAMLWVCIPARCQSSPPNYTIMHLLPPAGAVSDGPIHAIPYALNRKGQVVGEYRTAAGGVTTQHFAIWTDGVPTALAPLSEGVRLGPPAESLGRVFAINNAGQALLAKSNWSWPSNQYSSTHLFLGLGCVLILCWLRSPRGYHWVLRRSSVLLIGVPVSCGVMFSQSVVLGTRTPTATIVANSLVVWLPISNSGANASNASDVMITSATVGHTSSSAPSLPFVVGQIDAGAATTVALSFPSKTTPPGSRQVLTVSGTYRNGNSVSGFTLTCFLVIPQPNTVNGSTLTVAPSQSDPMTLQIVNSSGDVIRFFGAKDPLGTVTSTTAFSVQRQRKTEDEHDDEASSVQRQRKKEEDEDEASSVQRQRRTTTFFLDANGQIVFAEGSNGTTFSYVWTTPSRLSVTASVPTTGFRVTSNVDLPPTSATTNLAASMSDERNADATAFEKDVLSRMAPLAAQASAASSSILNIGRCEQPTNEAFGLISVTPFARNVPLLELGYDSPARPTSQPGVYEASIAVPDPSAAANAQQTCDSMLVNNPLTNKLTETVCKSQGQTVLAATCAGIAILVASFPGGLVAGSAILEECPLIASSVALTCEALSAVSGTLPDGSTIGAALCSYIGTVVDIANRTGGEELLLQPRARMSTGESASASAATAPASGPFPAFTIDIKDGCVTSIALSPSPVFLRPSQTVTLVVSAKDANGNVVAVPPNRLQWSSSSNAVTVDQNGFVVPQRTGTATVTVTEAVSQIKGTVQVTVSGDTHFWTIDDAELSRLLAQPGWVYEGSAGKAFPFNTGAIDLAPLWRFFESTAPTHFWTLDPAGELFPNNGTVTAEGIAAWVFRTQRPGTIPMYRFYNPNTNRHFWSTEVSPVGLDPAYGPEGAVFFVLPGSSNSAQAVPLYRACAVCTK